MFGKHKHKKDYGACLTPYDVTAQIYILLLQYLNKRKVKSKRNNEYPVDCTECEVERGCCKRRKLMLAMVEKILKWLKENKDKLQDIDFADDVTLVRPEESNSEESSTSDTVTQANQDPCLQF